MGAGVRTPVRPPGRPDSGGGPDGRPARFGGWSGPNFGVAGHRAGPARGPRAGHLVRPRAREAATPEDPHARKPVAAMSKMAAALASVAGAFQSWVRKVSDDGGSARAEARMPAVGGCIGSEHGRSCHAAAAATTQHALNRGRAGPSRHAAGPPAATAGRPARRRPHTGRPQFEPVRPAGRAAGKNGPDPVKKRSGPFGPATLARVAGPLWGGLSLYRRWPCPALWMWQRAKHGAYLWLVQQLQPSRPSPPPPLPKDHCITNCGGGRAACRPPSILSDCY